ALLSAIYRDNVGKAVDSSCWDNIEKQAAEEEDQLSKFEVDCDVSTVHTGDDRDEANRSVVAYSEHALASLGTA
ncbi:MAG: hypothetical protein ACRDL7_14415, partial [Gaiellaceae bacterium]